MRVFVFPQFEGIQTLSTFCDVEIMQPLNDNDESLEISQTNINIFFDREDTGDVHRAYKLRDRLLKFQVAEMVSDELSVKSKEENILNLPRDTITMKYIKLNKDSILSDLQSMQTFMGLASNNPLEEISYYIDLYSYILEFGMRSLLCNFSLKSVILGKCKETISLFETSSKGKEIKLVKLAKEIVENLNKI